MLAKELRDEPYGKTSYRRSLLRLLDDRSEGSIERKHQNISAVLIELGYPYIFGYKPLGNYQRLLAEVVASRLEATSELTTVVKAVVEAPAEIPSVEEILRRLQTPPVIEKALYPRVSEAKQFTPPGPGAINYLELEAKNASLGLAGEQFVLNYERARLIFHGCQKLADAIEHLPSTVGDRAGYAVRSYDLDGSDRLIEVKTTSFGKQTPFFLTRNELRTSQDRKDRYHLYRVFRFRQDPRLFVLPGAIDVSCRLEATQYQARVS